jgi:hypothetical protein
MAQVEGAILVLCLISPFTFGVLWLVALVWAFSSNTTKNDERMAQLIAAANGVTLPAPPPAPPINWPATVIFWICVLLVLIGADYYYVERFS